MVTLNQHVTADREKFYQLGTGDWAVRTSIAGPAGDTVKVTNGGLDVNIQDQHTPLLNLYFLQAIGAPTTLAAPANINDSVIVVTSAANISVGTYIGMFDVPGERYYFGEVVAINNVVEITLDTPLDFAFQAGALIIPTTRELNVDGSGSAQVFQINGPTSDTEIDITRIIISMTLGGQPDDAKFGDITGGLTNGLVLRRTDGTTRNIFNIKDNGEMAGISYDLMYTTRSVVGGQGAYGLRCRYTFAGQSKQGVTIRLGSDEQLELLVQDDLSDIDVFRIVAEGHEVE